jgi:hypothetical protein
MLVELNKNGILDRCNSELFRDIQTVTTGFAFSGNITDITTGSSTVVVSLLENVFGS